MQSQPAPIVRSGGAAIANTPAPAVRKADPVTYSQPAAGVYLSVAPHAGVTTVAATPGHTELRVDHGVANVNVHQSQQDAEILVDMPGGQVSLLKDGLYTFNADTKTFRVLHGEAVAYAAANTNGKGVKVKEDHQVVFGAARLRSVETEPYTERTDLLPVEGFTRGGGGYGFRGAPGYAPYYYGPYGDAFYGGYPYYGYYDGFYGYPYGFYGYPYLGFGFGYYGGFGGFRGGYGFHGRR